MRRLWALCLVVGTSVAISAARRKPEIVRINGQEYTPISEWASVRQFESHWIIWGARYQASDPSTTLFFEVDSRYVSINGVLVALSYPVANDHGVALIARMDLATALDPLLATPSKPTKPIRVICLDPGHGGRDSGNRVGGRAEKAYTLLLAREMRAQLKKAGFKTVFLTRSADAYVDLPRRPALANQRRADLFVSLHFNATETDGAEVKGAEVYCITPDGASSTNAGGVHGDDSPTPANRRENDSLRLAYQIQKSLVRQLGMEDRGVRRARFAVLRDARMPSVLVEAGYMTNPAESKIIFAAARRKAIAHAIVQGILAYRKPFSSALD